MAQNLNFQQSYNFSNFSDKLQKKRQQQGEEEFKKELEFMANKPTFTLIDYKQRIIDGLTKLKKGLKAKFMTGNEQTEANLMMQKKIINAMYDDELVNSDLLKGDQKKEIAMITQYDVSDVNTVIKNYKHLISLHSWIRQVKERGDPMPATQEELMFRFRKEQRVSKSYLKFEMSRPSYSQKMMVQRRKWGNKKQL
ncbi:Signal recognition particle, SRP54 subunit, M-domain [Pseudocohnilembus persalinus]|uniref:Signal recognition particle, SRP54 subunit, M-domain n=1 Tax=Pseudocohnilembus persalinus TaxID=266149 RepID=A0A0V0QYM5_PSEPJ|nr:Signal recognition particle, SRP54 subunit, M-domain [Pseudocohnilembus persalinus]|eukprot:KRX07281.1 Signal recognition particle, SRP54 subunit, M-domain [Pseudocohnilembus persalinus]